MRQNTSAGAAPQNEASPTKSLRNLNPVEKATKDFERRKIDVVCLGEAVVDFAIYGQAWKNFLKKYADTDRPAPIYVSAGGSPFIVAQVIRNKLGGTSEFIGRVGNDPFGQFLNESPSRGDSDYLRKLEKSRTRLILSSVPDGSHNFEYITHPAADGLLEATYVNDHCAEPIKNCSILHFGGMVLKTQSLADAAKAAVKMALDANCSISFDVTFRKHLWVEKVEKFVDAVSKAKAYKSAHILKFTPEEWRLFSRGRGHDLAPPSNGAEVRKLLLALHEFVDDLENRGHDNLALTVVTCGKYGCVWRSRNGREGYSVPHLIPLNETVDSLGAGDSFIGRLLLEILDRTGQRHKALTQDDILKLEDKHWKTIFGLANRQAAETVRHHEPYLVNERSSARNKKRYR